jgi:RsiW-degrading membrane proteinase PrsW (M82 family)
MFENTIYLLGVSSIIAFLPVIIWLFLIFYKNNERKKTIILIFFLGSLTAPALILLQVLWSEFPRFNLSALIETSVQSQTWQFIAFFMLFGALEEIIKMYVITLIDKKTTLIKTVNDTIRLTLVSALGFAFTENIYYLYQFWPVISTGELVGMYVFRSVFTTCAHMIFSGIFGYYYAMGKFSIQINKQNRLTNVENNTAIWISKIFNLPLSQAFQQKLIMKGLILSIIIHASYNFILQMGYKAPVVIFIILAAIYIWFLMKRKSGNLIINTDISEKIGTKLGKRDKDVIVELISMWFKEKRYVDVIHICQRLLERDPNNEVVKLFKAKSMDYLEDNNPYKQILSTILKTDERTEAQKNKLSIYLEEKENFKKVKEMIKKQLEKEGKKLIEAKKTVQENKKTNTSKNNINNSDNYLEKLTKGDSFKME